MLRTVAPGHGATKMQAVLHDIEMLPGTLSGMVVKVAFFAAVGTGHRDPFGPSQNHLQNVLGNVLLDEAHLPRFRQQKKPPVMFGNALIEIHREKITELGKN
jgi:hypothetical protein